MTLILEETVKLLIVDNDQNMINSISRSVKSKFNDEIQFTTCPKDAYKKIVSFIPDIIITDVNFNLESGEFDPELTVAGVALSRKIKKEFPQIKIIAISGYRNNDIIFEKIVEKDWYDYFHTKGSDDLYEKYEKLRNDVIHTKTGLIPYLSRFLSPLNFDGDVNKSLYRLLHTNYSREDNLKNLPQIEEFYRSFRDMLDPENSAFLDEAFVKYKNRDLNDKERQEIKNRFHIRTNDLECLYNSIRTTIYAEKNIIVGVWEKIISETKDHSDINSAKFNCEFTDNQIIFTVKQDSDFNFDKFLESKRTLNFYKKIRNYGDVIIISGEKNYSVVSCKFFKSDETVTGCIIKIILKILPR